MSTDTPDEVVAADGLERFDDGREEPRRTIEAAVEGLWWIDPDRGEDGRMSVEVRYRPDRWVLYPESLEDYLRQFEDVGLRPETAAAEIYEQLATLLFDGNPEESLTVRVESDIADDYEVQIGELE